MSQLAVTGNGAGTGVFTLTSPNSNTNRTITLPDATTTLVGADATQTLTNKTIQGGAITSGTAVASTSGTSIDFTSIPSWVKRITVMFSGVSTNGTSNPIIQLGDSGGVEATGYLSNSSDYTGSAAYTTGFGVYSNGAANILHGGVTIALLNSSTNTWACFGVINQSAGNYVMSMAGSKSLSGTLTQIRITTETGTNTFDAGSINILYE